MSLFRKTFTPSLEKTKDKEREILDIDYRRKVDPSFRDSFGRNQLHKLLLQGYDDPEEIDYLISNGCEVNLPDSESCYPIHIAADKGLTKCTKKLVQRNSLLDVFNNCAITPLMQSCLKGYTDIVSVLLQNGANPNLQNSSAKTAFHYVAMGGNIDTVKLILESKGKVNKMDNNKLTPLTLASTYGHTKVVHLLLSYPCVPKINPNLKDAYGRTSAHWVAAAGLHDVLLELCDALVDLNVTDLQGATPFILAIRNNRPRVLQKLLQHKVDRDPPDGLNGTCLGLASLFGHSECVKVLLDAGEDPNEYAYFGSTPMIGAVVESSVKTVEVLLNGGADPNSCGRKGVCPLLKSVISINPQNDADRHKIIKMLIRYGADTNIPLGKGPCMNYLSDFTNGKTDLMSFAVLSGYTSIVLMFLIAGSNVTKSWLDDLEQGPLSKNGLLCISDIVKPIRQWLEQPKSLSHLTRSVIRKSFGENPYSKLKKLPLAWKLKKYVDFEEFDGVIVERVSMKGEVSIEAAGPMIAVPACALECFKGTVTFHSLSATYGMCKCNYCSTIEKKDLN